MKYSLKIHFPPFLHKNKCQTRLTHIFSSMFYFLLPYKFSDHLSNEKPQNTIFCRSLSPLLKWDGFGISIVYVPIEKVLYIRNYKNMVLGREEAKTVYKNQRVGKE